MTFNIDNIYIEDLPRMPVASAARLPNVCAIYFVIEPHRVLYVGRTNSLVMRWRQHHLKPRLIGLARASIAWLETDAKIAKQQETAFINRYRPMFNERATTAKQGNRELLMFRIRPDVPSDQDLARRLRKAAALTGTPVSQLLRQGGEQVLRELAKKHPELAAA